MREIIPSAKDEISSGILIYSVDLECRDTKKSHTLDSFFKASFFFVKASLKQAFLLCQLDLEWMYYLKS